MKYATINKNDFINGEGVSVSLWMQGCPHHCPGCHNPGQWNFDGGQEKEWLQVAEEITMAITANGIQRNFSILGGEPLCEENILWTMAILDLIKHEFPNIKTFVWTGYILEELQIKQPLLISNVLKYTDVLIDGRYEQSLRDITLKWRGSSNQRILYKGIDF